MANYRRKAYSFREWLISLSGEDAQLIFNAKTNTTVRNTFAFIGCFVCLIFCASFYSSAHFIYQLFNENLYLAVPIGIVWGLMIANIYLLLLYTLTPKLLKGKERAIKGIKLADVKERGSLSAFSVGFRIGFVVLIAIIIAQPWLITTFSPYVREDLDNYKQQYTNRFLIQADSILIAKEFGLKKDLSQNLLLAERSAADETTATEDAQRIMLKVAADENFLSEASRIAATIDQVQQTWSLTKKRKLDSLQNGLTLVVKQETRDDSLFIEEYHNQVAKSTQSSPIARSAYDDLFNIISRKNQAYDNLNKVLEASNFYIRKIQLINSNCSMAWALTMLVVAAFIIPIVLKYRIRNTSNFYEVKRDLEEKVVRDDYAKFKAAYAKVFFSNFELSGVAFFESCIDPPFNTTKYSIERKYKDQKLLLSEIYNDPTDSDSHKYWVAKTTSRV